MTTLEAFEELIKDAEKVTAMLILDQNIYAGGMGEIVEDLYWLYQELTEYE